MMTKKTMTILSVFMIVALTAVGFAAWLIVGTIDAETTGSFVSNELKDKYFKVEVNFGNDGEDEDSKGKLIFGRPEDSYSHTQNAWLSYSNNTETDKVEKLSATATVKFIPDDGFSKKEGDVRDMSYYLLEEIEDSNGDVGTKQHRTVRVIIDIAEILEPATDNYKWFDMAVQLGYIQYPTAYVVQKDSSGVAVPGQSYESAAHKLQWYTNDSATTAEKVLVALEDNDYTKFQNGVLAIGLNYDQFFVDYGTGETAAFATADIQIDFAWGAAVNKQNPYTFFKGVQPETATTVEYYLQASGSDPVTYALAATTTEDDAGTADIDERDQGLDTDSIIRYKDLAQRMLDYLRDHLDYTADESGNTLTGIQFSITLIEGVPVEVE